MQMADFVRPRFSDELKELGNARVAQAVLFARRVNTGQDAASYAGVRAGSQGRGLGIKGRKQHLMLTARQVAHLVVA